MLITAANGTPQSQQPLPHQQLATAEHYGEEPRTQDTILNDNEYVCSLNSNFFPFFSYYELGLGGI